VGTCYTGVDNEINVTHMNNLLLTMVKMTGKAEKARVLGTEMVDLARKVCKKDSVGLSCALNSWGGFLHTLGDNEQVGRP
jgi:hypothetical protein